jgi:hypothetical protein
MGLKRIAKRLAIVAAAVPYAACGCVCLLTAYPAGVLVAILATGEFLVTGHVALARELIDAYFEGLDIIIMQVPCATAKWANA